MAALARALCVSRHRFWRFPRVGCGAVAQLGERLVRNEEVRGSIPLGSTTLPGRSDRKIPLRFLVHRMRRREPAGRQCC